jgi:hypothetical protein
VALDYRPEGMIADMIAPIVPTPNISGSIPEFSRGDLLRIDETARAPGTAANEVERDVSSLSFYCNNYALSHGVNIEDKFNADPIYVQKLFNGAAEFLKTKLSMDWERRLALQVTSTTNVGSSAAVTSAWTDYTNSDPLTDMNTAIDVVLDTNGLRPNNIVFGEMAWRNLRRNDTVRNLINGTNNGGGYVSTAEVAQLLEVENIHVGRAYQNTAAEGQTEALSQIWNDEVLVYYAPPSPSIFVPSFMYSMRWTTAGIPNMQVERHPYDSIRKRELIEEGYYQDERITGASYSFLVTAVTSST